MIKSGSVGAVRRSPVTARVSTTNQYPYGRAGFKQDADSRGSYVSTVTS